MASVNMSKHRRILMEAFTSLSELDASDLQYVEEKVNRADMDIDRLPMYVVHTCINTYTGRLSLCHRRHIVELIKEHNFNLEFPDEKAIWPEVEDNPHLSSSDLEIIRSARDWEIDVITDILAEDPDPEKTILMNSSGVASDISKIPYVSITKKSLFEERLMELKHPMEKKLIQVLPPGVVYIPVYSKDTGLYTIECYDYLEMIKSLTIDNQSLPISPDLRQLLCSRYYKEITIYRHYLETRLSDENPIVL